MIYCCTIAPIIITDLLLFHLLYCCSLFPYFCSSFFPSLSLEKKFSELLRSLLLFTITIPLITLLNHNSVFLPSLLLAHISLSDIQFLLLHLICGILYYFSVVICIIIFRIFTLSTRLPISDDTLKFQQRKMKMTFEFTTFSWQPVSWEGN